MKTIAEHGLMDYHMSPPATHQEELPGELFLMLMFHQKDEKMRKRDLMSNVNIEVFDSEFAER